MRFGLMIRGQYPQGDDMRVRLKEDLDAARHAEALGYDIIGKASHYSSHPFQFIRNSQAPHREQERRSWRYGGASVIRIKRG